MKTNALTIVHKYIRNRLFGTSHAFASAGAGDVDALKALLAQTVALLAAHANHEEARFEPVLRERDAMSAERLLRDHHALDAELDDIAARLNALDSKAGTDELLRLQLDWHRFVARYLLHLDDEERVLFAVIPDAIPAIDDMVRGVLEHDPEGAAEYLDVLGGLVSPSERAALEAGRGRLSGN